VSDVGEPAQLGSVEDAWSEALVRATAQTVFDNLTKIENEPHLFRNRWLWELFQNAVDASDGKTVRTRIEFGDDFVFSHDGAPFSVEEAVQLILHGSTKRLQAGKIGKFGTGFLTTHLLSKDVDVVGMLREGPTFSFRLDRNAASARDLEAKMTAAKDQLKKTSTSALTPPRGFTTSFRFHLSQSSKRELADAALETLEKTLPYVLAFIDSIHSVEVVRQGRVQTWKRGSITEIADQVQKIEITQESGTTSRQFQVIMAKGPDCAAALGLEPVEGGHSLSGTADLPKLFAIFPLAGTEDLPLPVVVNSGAFEATEERDGIWLAAITPQSSVNRKLMVAALALTQTLTNVAVENGWGSLYQAARAGLVPQKAWLDSGWIADQIWSHSIEPARELPIVKTASGTLVAPRKALIPYSPKPEVLAEISRLSAALYRELTPEAGICEPWAKTLEGWTALRGMETEQFPEALTLTRLAERVSGLLSLDRLQDALHEEGAAGAIRALDALLQVAAREDEVILSRLPLLPDQNGKFRTRNEIRRDDGIDETLKDVSRDLGIDERYKLLASEMNPKLQELLEPRDPNQLVVELVDAIRSQSRMNPVSESYQRASIVLLGWLVSHNVDTHLKGYPVMTSSTRLEEAKPMTELNPDFPLLAPVDLWEEVLRGYVDLFPPDSILAKGYIDVVSVEGWKVLADKGLVLASPLTQRQYSLDRDHLRALLAPSNPLDEDVDHRARLAMSTLAFLETDRGIMDRTRDSRERSVKFIEFLFSKLLKLDNSWQNPVEATCECESTHMVYPCFWMYAVKTRIWVCLTKKDRRPANAHSLAKLIEGRNDLQALLMEEDVSRFLERMTVTITDVMRNVGETDEASRLAIDKALVGILLASGKDAEALREMAAVWKDQHLRVKIAELREMQQVADRNRTVGTLVESLLKSTLAVHGISLEVTGRGSDFEFDHEFDSVGPDGQTVLSIRNFLLEVKSARGDLVKMTPAQAREAVRIGDNYILCVVPLPDDHPGEEAIRTHARFVFGLGTRLSPLLGQVNALQQAEIGVVTRTGDVEVAIERTNVRFKIHEQVWHTGIDFEALVRRFSPRVSS